MNRRTFLKSVPAFAVLAAASPGFAQDAPKPAAPVPDLQTIVLAKPEKDGGKSVLASLWERRTIRTVGDKPLPPQMLSNLLWAAWGVNRESGPRGRIGRTAASASNSQEIDLYVVLPEGIYLYDAAGHRLTPVVAGDHRGKVGRGQGGAMAKAPVNLVYVADIARYSQGQPQEPGLKDPEIQKSYANVAIGLIAGNVFLFAASQGLAAWFHNCNKPALATELKLRPDQHVYYAQTVGYPA
ncbi:MAG: SagB/ThcOx family dehydrogenase [Tepidisphaerales bacterium]